MVEQFSSVPWYVRTYIVGTEIANSARSFHFLGHLHIQVSSSCKGKSVVCFGRTALKFDECVHGFVDRVTRCPTLGRIVLLMGESVLRFGKIPSRTILEFLAH